MANTTVYPYGTGGSLPSSIGIINDPFTGGADKAWSAEQGKIINERITQTTEQDLSSPTLSQAFIILSTGMWITTSANYKCKFLPVVAGKTYLVIANAYRKSYVAVLKNTTRSNNTLANFATGCSIVELTKETRYLVTIPDDGEYLYFATLNNENDCTPQSISLVEDKADAIAESLGRKIDVINSQRIEVTGVAVLQGWIISSTNYWSNSGTPSSNYASICVPITPGEKYIIVCNKTQGLVAVLSSDTHSNGSVPSFATGYPSRMRLNTGESLEFIAPNDAHFVYICLHSGDYEFDTYLAVPKTIDEQFKEIGGGTGASGIELDAIANVADGLGNKLYPLHPELDENGFVLPETIQELNVQKKAKQFSNIVWTPLAPIPYNTYNSTNKSFPANTPVTGLPYSSVKELDKYVGKDVSIHTFMTAVNNPYSLLYTENVSLDNSQSAWGKTYHGKNCATYYGTVCSQFVAACNGGRIDYATAIHPWLAKRYHAEVRVYDQTAQSVRVGDLYWKDDHCRLIYAVKKNSAGVVTHVQIAESTYNHCIINSPITATQFANDMATKSCVIFRPLWLYKNIDYVPSPYVAVDDETPQTVTYNDDICTFAGDKACFREGETIAINYNLKSTGAWTAMELYKGSTLLDTITIDTSAHVVDLTSRSLTYGKYKARLTDGTNYSDYTEWEILQTNVNYETNGNITTVTPVSANGRPVAVKIASINGGAACMLELTEDEQVATSFEKNFVELAAEQMGSNLRGTTDRYLKVYFQGEFGRVTNEPIPISF